MGYANLGDYINVKGGATISDATYAKLPPLLRTFYRMKTPTATPPAPTPVKVQVTAAPSTNPIIKAGQALINNVLPTPAPTAPTTVTTAAQAVQGAAPIIAATAGGAGLGPIAAAIPAVIDAAAAPSPVRIRVDSGASPNLSPNVSTTPAPSSGGTAEIYNADGTPVTQAAVAATTGNVLASLKSLPPVALAALAGGVLFLLSKRGR